MEPLEIKRLNTKGIEILWSDGACQTILSKTLRDNCPCVDCRMKRGDDSHAAPLTPKKKLLNVIDHSLEESLSLDSIWGVGRYALGIKWKDGHDTGIYPFELLRELPAQLVQEAARQRID